MKILVIGYGFIGSHVVDHLLSKGHEVSVLERRVPSLLAKAHKRSLNLIVGDIRDRELVMESVYAHDGVINLAGILGTAETINSPHLSVDTNVHGALNVFEACKPCFMHPKGIPAVQIVVGNHWMNNTYSITKTMAERFAHMHNKECGTRIAIVRILNAYGPGQKHKPVRKIMPNFIVSALQGKPIKIYGDGEQVMDMIYVKDVADILCRPLLDGLAIYDGVIEGGTGRKTTVNQIADIVNREAGNAAGVEHVNMRAGEPPHSIVVADTTTMGDIGIAPEQLVKLEDGVKKTVEWYRENYPWKTAE